MEAPSRYLQFEYAVAVNEANLWDIAKSTPIAKSAKEGQGEETRIQKLETADAGSLIR